MFFNRKISYKVIFTVPIRSVSIVANMSTLIFLNICKLFLLSVSGGFSLPEAPNGKIYGVLLIHIVYTNQRINVCFSHFISATSFIISVVLSISSM